MNPWVTWPRKTRELHSHHFDSTTWMQQVIAQRLYGRDGRMARMTAPRELRRAASRELRQVSSGNN